MKLCLECAENYAPPSEPKEAEIDHKSNFMDKCRDQVCQQCDPWVVGCPLPATLMAGFCDASGGDLSLTPEQMEQLMHWCTARRDPWTFRRDLVATIKTVMPNWDTTAQLLLARFLLALAVVFGVMMGHVDNGTYYDALTEVVALRTRFIVGDQRHLTKAPLPLTMAAPQSPMFAAFSALWARSGDEAVESRIAGLPTELPQRGVHFVSLGSPVGMTLCPHASLADRESDVLSLEEAQAINGAFDALRRYAPQGSIMAHNLDRVDVFVFSNGTVNNLPRRRPDAIDRRIKNDFDKLAPRESRKAWGAANSGTTKPRVRVYQDGLTEFPDPLFGVHTEHSRVSYILLHELIHATWPQRYQGAMMDSGWSVQVEAAGVRSDMPAGPSEFDLTVAVNKFDAAYQTLIQIINDEHTQRVHEISPQESVPRMVTISLVNRGITSAKCLSILEYYLYSAYLATYRKDTKTKNDERLISAFEKTLRLVDDVAHFGADYTRIPDDPEIMPAVVPFRGEKNG